MRESAACFLHQEICGGTLKTGRGGIVLLRLQSHLTVCNRFAFFLLFTTATSVVFAQPKLDREDEIPAVERPQADPGPLAPSDFDKLDALLLRQVDPSMTLLRESSEKVPWIEPIGDPIEPFNRCVFNFNDGFVRYFLGPVESGYRFIAPEPVRRSIQNAGENLAYPVRLVNNLFQGKPVRASVETGRFVVNSTVGLLGFFDPAARIGMKPYPEDFAQTFGTWGAGEGFYLVVPFRGPSSGRGFTGSIFDMFLNIATYIPGLGLFFTFNDLSFTLVTYERLTQLEQDPYVLSRDFLAIQTEKNVRDYEPHEPQGAPLPTLGAIYLRADNPKFVNKAKHRFVDLDTIRKRVPYSLWLQKKPAPIVFILPGLGNHRLSEQTVAIASTAFDRGFSVVTISSTMNWEFMKAGSTAAVPGMLPVDSEDTYRVLRAINDDLRERYEDRIQEGSLLGISLGAAHTLYIAGLDEQAGNPIFERCTAVNPPVNFLFGLYRLDEFYNAPLAWPAEERKERIIETLLTAAAVADELPEDGNLPFDEIQSRYLIGLSFRLILRDILYTLVTERGFQVTDVDWSNWRREPLYDQLEDISYRDYMLRVAAPYYLNQADGRATLDELLKWATLQSFSDKLQVNGKVRVFTNEDDFLLRPQDLAWLRETFEGRLTLFENGGHLGNLPLKDVRDAIMDSLSD